MDPAVVRHHHEGKLHCETAGYKGEEPGPDGGDHQNDDVAPIGSDGSLLSL